MALHTFQLNRKVAVLKIRMDLVSRKVIATKNLDRMKEEFLKKNKTTHSPHPPSKAPVETHEVFHKKWSKRRANDEKRERKRRRHEWNEFRRGKKVLLRKPKPKKPKYLSRKKFLRKMADELKRKVPASERWFMEFHYADHAITSDLFNEPFGGYIPDIVNHEFKYIIEVQDGTHLEAAVIERDNVKRGVWKGLGFAVMYVIAWNEASAQRCIRDLLGYREQLLTQSPIESF